MPLSKFVSSVVYVVFFSICLFATFEGPFKSLMENRTEIVEGVTDMWGERAS